jgi:hypothetical protein
LHYIAAALRVAQPAALARLVAGAAAGAGCVDSESMAGVAEAGVRGLCRLEASLPRLHALRTAPAGGLRLDAARAVVEAYAAVHVPQFRAAACYVCPLGSPAGGTGAAMEALAAERSLLSVRRTCTHTRACAHTHAGRKRILLDLLCACG